MAESVRKNNKTICVAFPDKEYYHNCMEQHEIFRKFLNDTYIKCPAESDKSGCLQQHVQHQSFICVISDFFQRKR
ncbi:hypothetical protein QUF80_06290 [Desulfococcaceae bacterium HSG8]|nr:hypothetical protein [Desulfococcaceae bacterium HSG8]